MVFGRLRRGPSVREDWTNQGRALRRLGEPNAGRAYGSHRPVAVPQSALRGELSQSHDLLRAFHLAYRSGIPVRPATFGTLHFPSILSGLRPNDATKIAQIQKGSVPISKSATAIWEGSKEASIRRCIRTFRETRTEINCRKSA